jgi:hypothetical protein
MKPSSLRSSLFIVVMTMAGQLSAAEEKPAPNTLPPSDKAKALVQNAEPGLVTRISSFEEYGGGDVVFALDKPTVGCDGYWLKTSDPGFKSNLSILLMARSTKAPVYAIGYDERLWPGSTATKYCHVYYLQIQ